MYHKRKYKPINPEKYQGNPCDIIMRSSWETKFAIWCDTNPNVIQWSSETTIIPYICPTDNRPHKYYIDFKVKIKDKNNEIKTYLVEIKPFKQTQQPKEQKRKTRQYLTEVFTWGKNQAKWKAAIEFCKDRGYEFIILTEHELGITV